MLSSKIVVFMTDLVVSAKKSHLAPPVIDIARSRESKTRRGPADLAREKRMVLSSGISSSRPSMCGVALRYVLVVEPVQVPKRVTPDTENHLDVVMSMCLATARPSQFQWR
jgi:hypothetical protein